jgi:hypothetical protein
MADTPTPTPGAAAELPKTAWSYIPSDAWRDRVLTDDPEKVEIALGFGREVTALTPHAPAQAQLDALRDEVARLTKERDEARDTHVFQYSLAMARKADEALAGFKNFHRSLCARFGYVHDELYWFRDQVSLEEHIAALKAQPTDVDALMALADDYALRYFQCIRHGTPDDVANKNATREALRAKLAARKEEL